MAEISLKYGRRAISIEYDGARCEILNGKSGAEPLSDAEIGQRLDNPIGSPPLEEIVGSGESVLIVVPDATRQTACDQVVNLLVRRLIANGTMPFDIRIIFATGIHRKVTDDEKAAILTPFIVQRIKTLDHDPRDLARLVNIGETSGGIPVELNRALLEHDHVVLVGGISFHYFAGFTGGRKLVCPGLASSRTISATHKLAFDCETKSRREGVDTARLVGNGVHEAFVEAAAKVNIPFAIETITTDDGRVADIYCGNWLASHRAACDAYAAANAISIVEKSDLVIASCGGWPHDINMIQAHKALDAAARACNSGGEIIFIAECADGLGRPDFLDWFDSKNSDALAERLCQKYQVNGQTAWSLMKKCEEFDVSIVTSLDEEVTAKLGMKKIDATRFADKIKGRRGYILPAGSKMYIDTTA